ncbi:oxidoreductase [Cupriavidus pinatubonensis]|uniref:oxidoreductase n=1 Tax=Cupriavidus pinatubonensis TaxID=248026 RepID=UPI001C73A2A9|nr:oxidoreductase [Cupriavidus pinatubonensis]QYY29012.1 oxidoreductase [Cupriavidus pinatubonensis]
MNRFLAYRLHDDGPDGRVAGRFTELRFDNLPPGDVLIRVAYSGINYKDALAAAGRNAIVRQYPRTGGIDLSGHVAASDDPRFREGDAVVVHGFGIGVDHDGGHAQYARVRGDWVMRLPEGLSPLEASTIGVAGYTAALALHWMEHNAMSPEQGPVVVSGATGGVGSMAVDILSARGYMVHAMSGKSAEHVYLRSLGAGEIVSPEVASQPGKALEKARWAGAIDTVGGPVLAWMMRTMQPNGVIASVGNAGGPQLDTTVLPLILRGVRLLGINANSPMALREAVWAKLAADYRPRRLATIGQVIDFDALPDAMDRMLSRATRGRLVVRIDNGSPDLERGL